MATCFAKSELGSFEKGHFTNFLRGRMSAGVGSGCSGTTGITGQDKLNYKRKQVRGSSKTGENSVESTYFSTPSAVVSLIGGATVSRKMRCTVFVAPGFYRSVNVTQARPTTGLASSPTTGALAFGGAFLSAPPAGADAEGAVIFTRVSQQPPSLRMVSSNSTSSQPVFSQQLSPQFDLLRDTSTRYCKEEKSFAFSSVFSPRAASYSSSDLSSLAATLFSITTRGSLRGSSFVLKN